MGLDISQTTTTASGANKYMYDQANKYIYDQASMVVLVHTALDHRGRRDLIRETWGESFMPDKPTRLLFALGDQIVFFFLNIGLRCYKSVIIGTAERCP